MTFERYPDLKAHEALIAAMQKMITLNVKYQLLEITIMIMFQDEIKIFKFDQLKRL